MKSRETLMNQDRRFLNMVGDLDESGALRMMYITDLWEQMAEIPIDPAVPADIIEQFDKARHAYVYSWFAYDLVSLAEQQGYQTLELALREKLPPKERAKADAEHWGLGALFKRAYAHRWLVRAEFVNPDTGICGLDVIERCRNDLAHGSRNLFPGGSLIMLELCAGVLGKLFRQESA